MNARKLVWTAAFLYLGLLMGACAPMPPGEAPTLTTQPSAHSQPTPTRRVHRLSTDAAIAQARSVLAERLHVPIDQIEVVAASEDEMPLGDLGCGTGVERSGPQQPAMVLGLEIVLHAGDQDYVFHSDGQRLILCQAGEEKVGEQVWPEEGSDDSRATNPESRLVAQAVADLAERLHVAEDEITVRSVEAVEWSDTSLGCPQPGMMYAQVITPGYRIVLEAGGQRYEYHTDRSRVLLCSS
ncbi:MAG: hypothetical protein J7M34_11300 [Anaerolineae bacterium]|nr:hypothetical protein [Anaerolineae bacterium]